MSKHTPGEWEVLRQGKEIQGDGGHEVSTIINDIPITICELDVAGIYSDNIPDGSGPTYFMTEEESLSNAKLIASAPALLDLAKKVKALMEGEDIGMDGAELLTYTGKLIENVEGGK
jgi:hypothetical protein